MTAVTESGVHYNRVVFYDIDNMSFSLYSKLYNNGYIQKTEFDTVELTAHEVARLEDDVQAQATLAEDLAGIYTTITLDELQQFKDELGSDVYDALLQEEVDSVIMAMCG